MNKMLEKAIAALEGLSEAEQEHVASLILDELADEQLWDEKFSRDAGVLSALGGQALAEDEQGKTLPLVFPRDR